MLVLVELVPLLALWLLVVGWIRLEEPLLFMELEDEVDGVEVLNLSGIFRRLALLLEPCEVEISLLVEGCCCCCCLVLWCWSWVCDWSMRHVSTFIKRFSMSFSLSNISVWFWAIRCWLLMMLSSWC